MTTAVQLPLFQDERPVRLETRFSGGDISRSEISEPTPVRGLIYFIGKARVEDVGHKLDKDTDKLIRIEKSAVQIAYEIPFSEGEARIQQALDETNRRLDEVLGKDRLKLDEGPVAQVIPITDDVHGPVMAELVRKHLENAGHEEPSITAQDGKLFWLHEDKQIELTITEAGVVDVSTGEVLVDTLAAEADEDDEPDTEPPAEA